MAPCRAIFCCRSCKSEQMSDVIDLGIQRLSDFRNDAELTAAAPLRLFYCHDCGLAQLSHTVARSAMYHDGYGYRSGINEAIRDDLRSVVDWTRDRVDVDGGLWVDIASNDGTLLSNVPTARWVRVGVDPVAKFQEAALAHADRVVADYFRADQFEPHSADVITSVSMFYDIDDLDSFVGDVATVLNEHGVWTIQQNYLLSMLDAHSFDNICHEHLTYFSLAALDTLLRRHGLEVFDLALSPINGGCLRTAVARIGTRTVTPAVHMRRNAEQLRNLDASGTWWKFQQGVRNRITRLRIVVDHALYDGPVMVYGASTRGAVIWQACEFGPDKIAAAVERQDEKVGRWYSALGVPIISELEARTKRPAAMLVGPWWHRDLFVNREAEYVAAGGKLVFPLPDIEIVGGVR
jgi:hypothetical protein